MLVRISTTTEPYVNAIMLVAMLVALEFKIAMDYIKVYSLETKKVNYRRVFWYAAFGIPASIFIACIWLAALIEILS